MIPANLIEALRNEIADAVKDYKMKVENQPSKGVKVYAQHVPDDDFENDTFYPLIIVSLQKVEDKAETVEPGMSAATVGLTFGVYGEDESAWRDLLNIMEHVRQRLLTVRTINNRHRLILPTTWQTIEAQPYPFWFGYGTLVYSIGQPVEKLPESYEKITEEYDE